MSVYLDASVIVPLFVPDDFSARADMLIRRSLASILVSDFVALEFASVIALRVRMRERSISDAQAILSDFDAWVSKAAQFDIDPADIGAAAKFLRRLDLPLRTADAIHVAAAQRLGVALATFDRKMAASAAALGVTVVTE